MLLSVDVGLVFINQFDSAAVSITVTLNNYATSSAISQGNSYFFIFTDDAVTSVGLTITANDGSGANTLVSGTISLTPLRESSSSLPQRTKAYLFYGTYDGTNSPAVFNLDSSMTVASYRHSDGSMSLIWERRGLIVTLTACLLASAAAFLF